MLAKLRHVAGWPVIVKDELHVVVSRYVSEDCQHIRREVVHRWCSAVEVLWSGVVCRGV